MAEIITKTLTYTYESAYSGTTQEYEVDFLVEVLYARTTNELRIRVERTENRGPESSVHSMEWQLTAISGSFERFTFSRYGDQYHYSTLSCPEKSTYRTLTFSMELTGEGTQTFTFDNPYDPNRLPEASVLLSSESPKTGQSLTVSWSITDANEDTCETVSLTRYVKTAGSSNFYPTDLTVSASDRSCTDTVTSAAGSQIYYRLGFTDGIGDTQFADSRTVTVGLTNTPPTISGNDGDLGLKSSAFGQTYSVDDPDDNQTLTVREYLDGTLLRTLNNAARGTQYTASISSDRWLRVKNGSHTLKITADDGAGGEAVRLWSFSKNETKIEFSLTSPLEDNEAAIIEGALMNVTRSVPVGAVFRAYVTNNGFDASPVWQDVTAEVAGGQRITFTNTSKTAAKWGFSFRITVERGTSSGECHVSGVSGTYGGRMDT